MTDGVSNLATSLSMRSAVTRIQRELSIARAEASTGKIADRGLTLGLRSSLTVDMNEQVKRIDTIRAMNATVTARLETTQNVLDSIRGIVETAMEQITQARSVGGDMKLVQKAASDALAGLNDKLNASFNGQYLFAGVNTDVKPVDTDPDDPTSPGRAAVDASFQAQFGMSQTDPAVTSISAADMAAFLAGPFDSLFSDTGWRNNFSFASDKTIQSRVSMSEILDTSVTADAQGFRDATKALRLVAQSGLDKMSAATSGVVLDAALTALGAGQQGVTSLQEGLGSVQKRVGDANDRLAIQSQSLAKNLGTLEDVDPYAVSVRLNNLSTQIETAYALTSRIQQLSLLKYL